MFIESNPPLFQPTSAATYAPPQALAAAADEDIVARLARADVVHEDLVSFADRLLRADGEGLRVDDLLVARPLAASRRLRRLVHDAYGEEVGVDVRGTARVLCELPEALLPRLAMFDEIVQVCVVLSPIPDALLQQGHVLRGDDPRLTVCHAVAPCLRRVLELLLCRV
jgi:hypothetical protein